MLLYFGSGSRDYFANRIPVFQRKRWSFQAVLRGEISLVDAAGPGFLRGKNLWLCHPEYAHGWTGVEGKKAEVAVFQFPHLPVDLQRSMGDRPFLEIPLTQAQCEQIRKISGKVEKYWRTPHPGRYLHFEHTLLTLSLLVFENLPASLKQKPPQTHQQKRVILCLQWFEQRFHENPSLTEAARATGVSESQLRRDFMVILNASPKKVFCDIRLKRALEILQQEDQTVEQIADRCGFLSCSAFSRAFKNKFGRSPRKIETKKLQSRPLQLATP